MLCSSCQAKLKHWLYNLQQAISHPINNTLAKCLQGFHEAQLLQVELRWETYRRSRVAGNHPNFQAIFHQTLTYLVGKLVLANNRLHLTKKKLHVIPSNIKNGAKSH